MLEQVIAAAREAGAIIEDVRATAFAVEQKGDMGPVTEADRRADALLHERLLALEPCGWLSEETVADPARLSQQRLWCVDPLDWTKEFVEGVPQYSVAIALVDAGKPILGVVHNPATNETFWAEKGKGAFKNGKRVQVAEGPKLLCSRSEIKKGEFVPFDGGGWELTPIGSIEYKLALIASGEGAATVSRGPKHEWDVCAGALLVEEAGGKATDLFGSSLTFNQSFPKTKGILAGSPIAYERVASIIAKVGASDRMDEFANR